MTQDVSAIIRQAEDGINRLYDMGGTVTVLVLAVMLLFYIHRMCLKKDDANRAEMRQMSDKFATTLEKTATSNTELSSAVRELSNVVRNK